MDHVPTIDVSALMGAAGTDGDTAAARATAEAIDRACRTSGFFLVVGHGVDPDLQAELDGQARTFFALDDEAKAAISMERGGRAWRGWFPVYGELTAGAADHKEGIYFGAELGPDDPRVRAGVPLHGPNLFPTQVPGLAPAVHAWMEAMSGLAQRLLRGIALGLGLDATWFEDNVTDEPTTLFRIFRYPPSPDHAGWGVAEHTDYGLLTILAHDGRSGLQVRGPGGWTDVPVVADSFVVNIGDMLDRMTGGRYRSTPHRVRHTDGEGDRLSFPFFFDPSWDGQVRPLPLSDPAPDDDAASRWDGASVHLWEGTYGDYLTAKVTRVFPDLSTSTLDRPDRS